MQYDGSGNRTRLQWPSNTNGTGAYFVTYTYDALNRMTEIDANGSTATPLAKYQWDALSRQTLITYGDNTTDSYSQYDTGDNLQTLTESFSGGQNNVTFSYSWFKNHQRQSLGVSNGFFQFVPGSANTTYATADANNGYTSVAGVTFTYDANRNLTYDGANTLTYDVENRLIQAANASSGTTQYQYDPLGRRKQKVANGVTAQFILAGDDEIADYSGTGVGTPSFLTVRGAGGFPVAAVDPSTGTPLYYHHDALGSTVAMTQAGTVGPIDISTYGDYGEPGSGSWAPYRYAGYRYDSETGFYYVRARHYSPFLGRFLQTDPIGFKGGANLYAYVGNDPVNATDPAGTCSPVQLGQSSNASQSLVIPGYQVVGPPSLEPNGTGGSYDQTSITVTTPIPFVGAGASITTTSNGSTYWGPVISPGFAPPIAFSVVNGSIPTGYIDDWANGFSGGVSVGAFKLGGGGQLSQGTNGVWQWAWEKGWYSPQAGFNFGWNFCWSGPCTKNP